MRTTTRTVCWDACTFLSLIEETPDRVRDLRAVLHEAIEKEIRLIASSICITEVAFSAAERAGGLSEEVERKIAKLWLLGSPVQVVDYSPLIARKAQVLLRKKLETGLHLKPLDAIHIATAMQERATELHTYDRRLWAWSDQVDLSIKNPIPHQMLLDDQENMP